MGERMEKITLTNMCMIYNKNKNQVLVQNRIKNWKGIAFPGGHVEKGEAIIPSVIREIKEETGLDITNPKLIGIRDWYDKNTNERTISFLFVCSEFNGTLIEKTEEGEVFFVDVEELGKMNNFAYGFKDQLQVFLKNNFTEVFSINEKDNWKYIYY